MTAFSEQHHRHQTALEPMPRGKMNECANRRTERDVVESLCTHLPPLATCMPGQTSIQTRLDHPPFDTRSK